ncbi:hypothetical protein [Bordetella trematum]|uniref:hypothetical protein n=1 Tax=Bordetella trematum TaxID=123899 RepID=UPI0004707FEF|nr:hypothetical protein [Bordetella trematum]
MTQKISQLSGQLCAREDFRAFCGTTTADEAAAYIRRVCRVQSRRELDHNPEARDRFHELVRKPFAYRTAP